MKRIVAFLAVLAVLLSPLVSNAQVRDGDFYTPLLGSGVFVDGIEVENQAGNEESGGGGGGARGSGGGSDGWSLIPKWVTDLMDKISELWETLQDLMTGQFIKDAIDGLFIKMIDEWMSPFFNVFGKSYLSTPKFADIALVQDAWTTISIIGLALLFFGIAFLIYKMLNGEKEINKVLIVFIGSFVLLIFSMTIINLVIVVQNWIVQDSLANMLETSNIEYNNLAGEDVVKAMVVGVDSIQNTEMSGMTVGELIYSQEGGLGTLFMISLFIIFPLWLVTILKNVLLLILVIFVAFWIVTASYTGNYDSVVGYANLFIRTQLVGVLMAMHWGISVKMQTKHGQGLGLNEIFGFSPIYMMVFMTVVLLVVIYFMWFKPSIEAIKSPITLAGGNVIENIGKFSDKASSTANHIGKRLAWEGLQESSLDWKARSQKMIDYGQQLQEGQPQDMFASMMGIQQYDIPDKVDEWVTEVGSVVKTEEIVNQVSDVSLRQADTRKTISALKDQGFKQKTMLSLSDSEMEKVQQILEQDDIKWQYGDNIKEHMHLDYENNVVVLEPDTAKDFLKEIEKTGVKTNQLQNVYEQRSRKGSVYYETASKDLKGNTDLIDDVVLDLQKDIPATRSILAKLSQEDFKSMQTKARKDGKEWVDVITHDQIDNRIQVPYENVEEVQSYLRPYMRDKIEYVRFDLPNGSNFAADMLMEWKRGVPSDSWEHRLTVQNNSIAMRPEDQKRFKKKFEEWKKDRIPYWTAGGGKIKVVIDGIPADYGHVPANGINMGKFESMKSFAVRRNEG